MDAWRAGFQSANPDVNVNYDPVGSGGGRTQFLDGSVQFAGSDSRADERGARAGEGASAPPAPSTCPSTSARSRSSSTSRASPSSTCRPPRSRGSSTARSPRGTRRRSRRRTPTRRSRPRPITPVHRSDESGTTKNFTDYLAKASGGVWTVRGRRQLAHRGRRVRPGHLGRHPDGPGRRRAPSRYADNSAVGTLGMVEHRGRRGVGRPVRGGRRGRGRRLARVTRSARTATSSSRSTVRRPSPGAYPLILVSYCVACLAVRHGQETGRPGQGLPQLRRERRGSGRVRGGRRLRAAVSDALRTDVQAAIDAITAAA